MTLGAGPTGVYRRSAGTEEAEEEGVVVVVEEAVWKGEEFRGALG